MNDEIYKAALLLSRQKRARTLVHTVEHAGFGAILSRLMTGFNLSLVSDANYSFYIDSPYRVEEMFDIKVKTPPEEAAAGELLKWDFFSDTWNASADVRANHQFPKCPIEAYASISRHQWCSVLAYCICGNPSPSLVALVDSTKKRIGWNGYDLRIGLHVRRGDKTTEAPYIPTGVYLKFLQDIQRMHPEKKTAIFLASDDPAILPEFESGVQDADILWDSDENRYNNYNAKMVAMDQTVAEQESMTAAKNILMLGECDYVIGMSVAQFAWIGGLLSVFRNDLDTKRHVMIDPHQGVRGHWACYYGFSLEEAQL